MFDPSAPHIIILLVVVLLLFGSKRLPGAAKSMGQAMRNFKGEMKSLHDDDDDKSADTAQTAAPSALQQPPLPQPLAQPAATPDVTQQQLSDLQRQIEDLQVRQNVGTGGAPVSGAPLSEAQPNQQPF
jgi:sec-independent protein translocase protein TatA